MLTERANRFLKTLKRRPFIPTNEVEAIIQDQGGPCFAVWLDFHERYAGYELVSSTDVAIWGLIHENPRWLQPRTADIDREPREERWYIACADTHPSYTYQLDNHGEFLGTPSETFDIYVERVALRCDFHDNGGTDVLALRNASPQLQEMFDRELKQHLVPEASDRFSRYYMSKTHFATEDAETGELIMILKHENSP